MRALAGMCCAIVLILVGSLAAVAVAGTSTSKPKPVPTTVKTATTSTTTTPQQDPGAKACPASTRYNPKTHRCDPIRF